MPEQSEAISYSQMDDWMNSITSYSDKLKLPTLPPKRLHYRQQPRHQETVHTESSQRMSRSQEFSWESFTVLKYASTMSANQPSLSWSNDNNHNTSNISNINSISISSSRSRSNSKSVEAMNEQMNEWISALTQTHTHMALRHKSRVTAVVLIIAKVISFRWFIIRRMSQGANWRAKLYTSSSWLQLLYINDLATVSRANTLTILSGQRPTTLYKNISVSVARVHATK